ncbi:hypothetical protein BJ170DRAFT_145704 [Xylariales sp. AK1849]|nr:hypothetical protein BJ170DRAFT_145704 [Xylariales sp. AK1849]
MGLFWSKKTPPKKVDSDEVVPLPYFDDTFLLATFVLHSLLVFDDALDAEKLRDALERLAQRDGWRKLAARLRKNTSGGLEYHIPTKFSADRPAITYTHVRYETAIGEHPLASRLPRPSTKAAVVGVAEDFSPLYLGSNSATKFDDFVYQDRSLLGLHIISFNDATIIVLNWIHAAFDAMAKKAILDAWTLMIEGRDDEILKPLSYRDDVLSEVGKSASAPHKLVDRRLGTLGTLGWALTNVVDLFFRRQETRVFCLPAGFIEGLRTVAMKELAAENSDEKETWVSEGDILVAWLSKIGTCQLPSDSDKTIVLTSPFCYRKAFADSLLPPDRPFISNGVSFFNVLLPLNKITASPLSYTAQQTRLAIKEQSTRDQIEAHCALLREGAPNKVPPLFGDSSMHMINFSNWTKANFYSYDFSSASTTGSQGPVRARYIQNTQGPIKFAEIFLIVGKDSQGNYWVSSTRTMQKWAAVDQAWERGDIIH